jgi:hypothetical protein
MAERSAAFDRRTSTRGQRLGQGDGLPVRGQGSPVVAEQPSLPALLVQRPGQRDPLRHASLRPRRQLAADRHRLPERLQRLRPLADPVDQLSQLQVRLGQHRLRGGVGLATEQAAEPVVEPPSRSQQLVP